MTKPISVAYCTLNRIIRRLNADSSDIIVSTTAGQTAQINTESANFQAEMKADIRKASDMIRHAMNNEFVPYLMTWTLRSTAYRKYLGRYDSEDGGRPFRLPDNNLTITAFTWDGTSFTEGTHYYRNPIDTYPTRKLIIDTDAITSYPDDFADTVVVTGLWGYHPDPANMWLDSGDTVQDSPLSATATTLNVTDGDNFQIMQYIRIEDEYLLITAISTNALTVERGVNGTTAASHTNATQIDTYVENEAVATECARLAIREYLLRHGLEVVAAGETAFELNNAVVMLPNSYKRYSIGSA
jgi:hypothetical protein